MTDAREFVHSAGVMPRLDTSMAVDGNGSESEGVDLRFLIGIVQRHWKSISAVFLALLGCLYVGMMFVRPLYKSTAEILVFDPRVQMGDPGQRPSSFEIDNAAMSSDVAFLQSKALALRVAADLQLDQDTEFHKDSSGERRGVAGSDRAGSEPLLGRLDASDALDQAAEQLRKRIQVERVQLSYVLTVSVTSEDPVKARRLTEAVANAFLREHQEIRNEAMQKALEWWTNRVLELRARVADTEAEIEKIKTENGLSDSGMTPALQKLAALKADSQAYIKLRELEPVAQSNRKFYEAALAQLDSVSQRLSLQGLNGRLITPASFPDGPSYPRRSIVYGIGGLLALGVALGLAFLREFLNSGIKTAAALERVAGYPVIGMLPLVSRGNGPLGRTVPPEHMSEPSDFHLREAVRAMRAVLRLSDPEDPGKVVLVTSGLPGEGKSTVAMLLAASCGRSGERALLIDCDSRLKSVSREFGLYRAGWSEVLTGKIALADAILTDTNIGFSVLPVGNMTEHCEALLGRPMQQLLTVLRQGYDLVIIDTGPLLGSVEPLILADRADKVLLVVAWDCTPQATVSEALRTARFHTNRICGIVLNKVDYKRLHTYDYAAGYHYGAVYEKPYRS